MPNVHLFDNAMSGNEGSSTVHLTVITSRAESFDVLELNTKVRYLFPSTHQQEHQPFATVPAIAATTFSIEEEADHDNGQTSRVTIAATALPPANQPDWTVHVPDQNGWRRIQGRKTWIIPRDQGTEATFAVQKILLGDFKPSSTTASPPQPASPALAAPVPVAEASKPSVLPTTQRLNQSHQRQRLSSPSVQIIEAPKKTRKPQKTRDKKAPIYAAKGIRPIYDNEPFEAYLARHIKKEHHTRPNGFEALCADVR